MTKADLIGEVSRLAEPYAQRREVIVEGRSLDSVVRSLPARRQDRNPRLLAASAPASANRASAAIPKTGERVEVPAKKIPFFKPSKELKDLVTRATAPHRELPHRQQLQLRRCKRRCLQRLFEAGQFCPLINAARRAGQAEAAVAYTTLMASFPNADRQPSARAACGSMSARLARTINGQFVVGKSAGW